MIIKGKRTLVTGGAGFIGSHLVDALIADGAENVVVVDNFFLGKKRNLVEAFKSGRVIIYNQDASEYHAMEDIIKKENIEVVFNLATKALGHSFIDPDDAFMVNVNIASTLLRLLHKGAYQTLVQTSSSEAYGSAEYVPIDEKHPFRPLTLYAAGKAAADLMVESYVGMFKVDALIVRPFNNYGPRQNEGTYAAIIPLTVKRIENGEKPIIHGDGLQTRDFIYVGDTVRGIISAYENEKTRGIAVNIASGVEVTIKEIIETIVKEMDYRGEIEYESERTADVRRHLAGVALSEKILDFRPEVKLSDGIKKTVQWYQNNKNAEDDLETLVPLSRVDN